MRPALLAAAALTLMSGCAAHEDRVYDPITASYHIWGPDDAVYYNRWIGANHRSYVEYSKLSKADQNAYWKWRHAQPPEKR